MRKKFHVSLLIFSVLFIGASYLNLSLKREFYIPGVEEMVDIIPTEKKLNEENMITERVKMFQPREYVRLRSVL